MLTNEEQLTRRLDIGSSVYAFPTLAYKNLDNSCSWTTASFWTTVVPRGQNTNVKTDSEADSRKRLTVGREAMTPQ